MMATVSARFDAPGLTSRTLNPDAHTLRLPNIQTFVFPFSTTVRPFSPKRPVSRGYVMYIYQSKAETVLPLLLMSKDKHYEHQEKPDRNGDIYER
jgi:hypothetical protein